jgi:hypothetical protein
LNRYKPVSFSRRSVLHGAIKYLLVKSAVTDISTKLVCVYKFTQIVSLWRSNRPGVRPLCVFLCVLRSSARTSFVCFNSAEGGVHFKNSLDLMESQRIGRAPALWRTCPQSVMISHSLSAVHSLHILSRTILFPVYMLLVNEANN